jgi:hypothetical protein
MLKPGMTSLQGLFSLVDAGFVLSKYLRHTAKYRQAPSQPWRRITLRRVFHRGLWAGDQAPETFSLLFRITSLRKT